MELELGLKITRTPHDFSSASGAWFARNGASPRFVSKETDTAIVLTGHMKGYRREHISIKINEHGTRIVIGGEKPVQEMIMMGWIMLKKEVEIREFRKVFRIPEGIVLDRIKAKYNQDGSILAIHFPKLIKGISGIVIEEEPEETEGRIHEVESSGIEDQIPLNEENDQISSVEETRQITDDNIVRERQAKSIDKAIETMEEACGYEEKEEENRIAGGSSEQKDKDLVAEMEDKEAGHEIIDASIPIPDLNYHQRETHEVIDERKEGQGAEFATKEAENENDETQRQMERKQQKETENEEEQTQKIVQEQENDRLKGGQVQEKVEKKRWNPFVIAGSAFLASSLLVIVLGLVRAKRKDKK